MGKKDIRFLLMCIKYAKDKEAFSRLRELTGTAVVSEDTCGTIAEYLGEPELLKKGTGAEGGRDMCEAIRALVEDGRNEGMREGRREGMQEGMREGRQEGIELAKRVIRMAGGAGLDRGNCQGACDFEGRGREDPGIIRRGAGVISR